MLLPMAQSRASNPWAQIMNTRIDTMPQLRQICWNRRADGTVTDEEALALYERNWDFVDIDAMGAEERAFLDHLVVTVGHGHLMVT